MNCFRCLVGLLLCLLGAGCNQARKASPDLTREPVLRSLNIVLITVDTLRPDHLGCYGFSQGETPIIDGIAKSGVLFEQAVTQTPLTPPSHASIFTGLNPPQHHVRDTGGFMLSPEIPTLTTILHQRGWSTAAFISSSVLKKSVGFNHGFDVYDDRMPRSGAVHEFQEDAERRAGATVDEALKWLALRTGRPFFLWVHLYDPHAPYQAPAPFRDRYAGRPYDGEIAYADHELGRLMTAVRQKSPGNRTLIALLSDHGESLGEHGEYSHGVFLYDSTLRIAFLLSGPGVPVDLRVKQQARTIDVLPTILDLIGVAPPASIQGVSLTPYFAGRQAITAVSYAETIYPKINMGWAELRGLRTNAWKYIRAPKPELYDLRSDPGETTNIYKRHPADAEKFEAQLNSFAGNGRPETLESSTIDASTMRQLQSLGYTAGFSNRTYRLTGQGADPKDRVDVLRLMDAAERPGLQIPVLHRIDLLRQALLEDPTNPLLYYSLGSNYEKAGNYAAALDLYRSAGKNGIVSARLHSRIADLLVRSGHKEDAIPEYEKAAQIDPSDVESQANLATAYLEEGRPVDAEQVFHRILAIEPTFAAAYNGLGVIAIQKQDTPGARIDFEKAVELDADLMEAQLNLGLIYERAGERDRARTCFRAFLAKASGKQYGETIPKVRAELAALQ